MEGYGIGTEDFLQLLLYLAYLHIIDDKVAEVSYAFEDLTGYGKEHLMHKPLKEVFNLIFRAGAPNQELITTASDMELFLFTKSNEVRFVNFQIHKGVMPGECYCLITEKPKSRLEDRFPYLEQLFRANHTGIAVYGMPGFILLRANMCYLNYLDEPYNNPDHAIGRPIHEILAGWSGSLWESIWKEASQSVEVVNVKELPYNGFKRGITYWDMVITPIVENGGVRYLIGNTVEVTERILNKKSMEECAAIAKQQREEIENILKLKEEFFSLISHEFKTPLTVINAAVQAMEHICLDEMSPKAKKFAAQIKLNSLRLLRLVNNLLDISKMENGYMKLHRRNIDIVRLTRMITESVMVYAKEKGVNLSFESPLEREIIALDEEKYERIMLNLLSNAIKFTPPGKSVVVTVASKHGIVCVEVKDEGIGIPAEEQGRIFDRFWQVASGRARTKEGTGIGLFLTKLFVEALGGEIVLDSEVGKGSTFTVLLPAVTVSDAIAEEEVSYQDDSHSMQAAAIEFSDIYPIE